MALVLCLLHVPIHLLMFVIQVLVRVKAFGLNRSEMFNRQGKSTNVKFPRILGIEAVGIVEASPGGQFSKGDIVATAMGGKLATLTSSCRTFASHLESGHYEDLADALSVSNGVHQSCSTNILPALGTGLQKCAASQLRQHHCFIACMCRYGTRVGWRLC